MFYKNESYRERITYSRKESYEDSPGNVDDVLSRMDFQRYNVHVMTCAACDYGVGQWFSECSWLHPFAVAFCGTK